MNTSKALKTTMSGTETSPLHLAEMEFAKDIWDVRAIPGAQYMEYSSNHLLNFIAIPLPFRPVVKQYLRYLISSDLGQGACKATLRGIHIFLHFMEERSFSPKDLVLLTPPHVDAYLQYLKGTPNARGKERSQVQRSRHLSILDRFLRYLQRIESPLAPQIPVDKIIWFEHKVPQSISNSLAIKFIPKLVLDQLAGRLHL